MPTGTPPGVQWVTPPSEGAVNSDGVALQFCTLSNILDTTKETQEFKYSGLCLLTAKESTDVEQALSESCWRRAMEDELKSIRENSTWESAAPIRTPSHWAQMGVQGEEGPAGQHHQAQRPFGC